MGVPKETSSAARGGATAASWIISHSRGLEPIRLRLFCFPYAGGSAHIFDAWPGLLPSSLEVVAVQLPGRGKRFAERPYVRLASLVTDLQWAIAPLLDRPFAIFGHSMGALLAFELTRCIRRKGWKLPVQLFVSGARAPHNQPPERQLHTLSKREFVAELRQLNGTPPEILEAQELIELLLPTLYADFELLETYTYAAEAALPVPITALGGLDDPTMSPHDLSAWRAHTSEGFCAIMFPGDHFFIKGCERQLLRLLGQCLAP